MRITLIGIHNYKSLRSVEFRPAPLSILVGANASGKSNFADCIDFIAEVYRHGLEIAVGRKGGYENIAFRKLRRSKAPISIRVAMELDPAEVRRVLRQPDSNSPRVLVEHSFSFVARGISIRAEFEVKDEELVVSELSEPRKRLATIRRSGDRYEVDAPGLSQRSHETHGQQVALFNERVLGLADLRHFEKRKALLPKTELMVSIVGRFVPGMFGFLRALSGIRVFQITPAKSREFGVPTPSPELGRNGENLPAVIDRMQRSNRSEWRTVMRAMRSIIPELASIEAGYTSGRTLGLFFRERSSARPWAVEEVSDGTIQSLALLAAIYNPTSSALVVEEPENSVHPWIIRHFIQACREASARKQIILTTHSPIVINAVPPEQVWIVWKRDGESHFSPLGEMSADFLPMWQEGEIPTFDYLDSGAIVEAVPPGPTGQDE